MQGAELLDRTQVIIFWGVVTLLLVILIVRRGRHSRPSQLRLGGGRPDRQAASLPADGTSPVVARGPSTGAQRASARAGQGARQLNLIFDFRGQKYDAYQVLDLPAGSSMEQVTRAYDLGMAAAHDPERRELIRAAYKALAG